MIRNGDISNQAKIDPVKLRPGDEAQLLIAQDNGRFKAVTIKGDAKLTADGRLSVNGSAQDNDSNTNSTFPDLAENEIAVGDTVGIKKVNLGTGSSAIPQRDSSGVLKAETSDFATNATNADTATNSTKLNNQAGTYYTDVTNHVAQSSADSVTLPTDGSALNLNTATTRRFPSKIYEAIPTVGSVTEFKIPHNFGYYPSVQVLADVNSNGDYEEIDAFVENGTTSTTIKTSEQGLTLKFILA